MKYGPDMNYLSSVIFSWRRGVLTFDEARDRLIQGLDPARYMPEAEQIPEPMPPEPSPLWHGLKRVEQKLNVIIEHLGIALPDEVNPKVLSEDAIQLLKEKGKIAAIHLHRERTGAGLVEAKQVFDDFIERSNR